MTRFQALLAAASLLATFGRPVTASEICHQKSVPPLVAGTGFPVTVPGFDPALGTLTRVRVELSAGILYSLGLENVFASAGPTDATSQVAVSLAVDPPGSLLLATGVAGSFFDSLAQFDGITDWRGTSGVTHPLVAPPAVSASTTDPADLAAFTATTVALPFDSVDSTVILPWWVLDQVLVSAKVRVCYEYDPGTSSYCEGSLADVCPCDNESPASLGQGCRNATGVGAHLAASGVPSVSADTLALEASGMPAPSVAMLIQGEGQVAGGAGTPYGDGLWCLGAPLVRLGVQAAPEGVSSFPAPGAPPISVAGGVPPGATRHYQVRYRDAADFCTVETFNTTQGISVLWAP